MFGARTGQIVSTQLAVALLLAGAAQGAVALVAAALPAAALLALTWIRFRSRWVFEWAGTMRYTPDGTPPAGITPGALLGLVAPGARIQQADLAGDQAAVIVDGYGMTAVLELGDPTGLLVEALAALAVPRGPAAAGRRRPSAVPHPAPAGRGSGARGPGGRRHPGQLLPAAHRGPPARAQPGVARGTGAARRGWSDEDLRRALSGLVRKLPRKLGDVPARPLGEAAAIRVLAEPAHHDDVDPAGGELARPADRRARPGDVPAAPVAGPAGRDRTPAGDPDAGTARGRDDRRSLTAGPRSPGGPRTPSPSRPDRRASPPLAAPDLALGVATQALRKLLGGEHAYARRLDGEHLDGLAATLPLGGAPPTCRPATGPGASPPDALDGLELPVGSAGLMLGSNRHGAPVVARLFRPEQTRALLIGGVRCAQLVALRAMAVGARVVVQTARPQAWEPFVRGAAVPGESIAVVPPGARADRTGLRLHPLLVVVDVGPVGADTRPGTAGRPPWWSVTSSRPPTSTWRPAPTCCCCSRYARTRRRWWVPRWGSAMPRSG